MRYYIPTPFCAICENREETAGMIADVIADGDAARTAYSVFCAGNEFYHEEDDAGLEEWATYEAYDLLDKAERCGRSAAYGVTVYASEEAAALEERASDAFDPWRGPDARVAVFCAIYNGGEELEWLLEQLHDLIHDVDPEEAEKILALVEDISHFDGERRPA